MASQLKKCLTSHKAFQVGSQSAFRLTPSWQCYLHMICLFADNHSEEAHASVKSAQLHDRLLHFYCASSEALRIVTMLS